MHKLSLEVLEQGGLAAIRAASIAAAAVLVLILALPVLTIGAAVVA